MLRCRLGRPQGRVVISSCSAAVVRSHHASLPRGLPRWMLR